MVKKYSQRRRQLKDDVDAKEVAVKLDQLQRRRTWRRNAVIASSIVGAAILAILFLRFGFSGFVHATRCKIRISPSGITVDGVSASASGAATICAAAGGADVIVTGDTRQGDFEDLIRMLLAAKVSVFVH